MPKQLRINKLDARDGLTVKELISYLSGFPLDRPVVLKCGRNYRLGKLMPSKVGNNPVLVGKRSALK